MGLNDDPIEKVYKLKVSKANCCISCAFNSSKPASKSLSPASLWISDNRTIVSMKACLEFFFSQLNKLHSRYLKKHLLSHLFWVACSE